MRDRLAGGRHARGPRRAPAARPRPARARVPGPRRADGGRSRRCARSTRSRATCPRQLTSFVGRDEELAEIADALDERAPGHAHRCRRRRQDPARAPGRGRGAARASRTARGCASSRRADGRRRWRRSSRRRSGCRTAPGHVARRRASSSSSRAKQLLLVLDNCEHLLDAGGDAGRGRSCGTARACGSWRRAARGSRSTASRSVPLRSLPLPDASSRGPIVDATTRCGSSSSGREAARPTFALDAANVGGGRRDLPAPRRHPARDRARGGAGRCR